jgi:uncharacterized protein YhaN
MRLNRLDLTRYGKFTNRVIDFGERPHGGPDLHFIYGPNEAGKSTALAAFLDLLFKIGNHFNFLHDYNAMRVGACLEFDGRVHEFVRIKGNRNDLLDGDGRPISEAIIAGQLGGIDRQSYRAMFSLDDETIEAGGESILASKGDLGQLLFSASTGLADLSRTLTDLRAEADGYYKLNARSGELRALKDRLAALKTQREEIDTIASGYAQLIVNRDRALVQYNEAIASRTAIHSRMDQIQGYVNALPRLIALRDARERLLPLGDLPVPPAGWSEVLAELQKAETEIAVRSETIDLDIARKVCELETTVVDEAALAVADRVELLRPLHARHVTAEADIPDRCQTVRELDLEITGILGRIGRGMDPSPERFVLDAATVGGLNDLITKRSGIETALLSATKELSDAHYALEEALTTLREADVGTGTQGNGQVNDAPLSALAAVVATLQGNDHGIRRRTAERSRDAFQEALADRLRALHPWHGDIKQLVAASVPGQSDISRWKSALATARADNDRCAAEVERLTSERLRLAAEHAAFERLVNDQDAGAVRAAREAAWASHRRTLDTVSADIFEAALRRDDLVIEARLNHQSDLAKLHESSLALARAEAGANRAAELHTTAAAALQRVHDKIATAAAPFLPAGASVEQFETWLATRDKALEISANLRQATRDLHEAEADTADARQRLISAMDVAGLRHDPDASGDALRAMAQATLDRQTQLKGVRAAVEQCRRNVKLRERNHAAESQRDRNWHAAWQTVCSGCWLGERESSPPLATVREILLAVGDLRRAIDTRAGLNERINAMRADQAAFANALNAIASELGLGNDAPLDLERALIDRVNAATTARSARTVKVRELERAHEQRRELAEAREIHGRRKAEMTGFFGVSSLIEVAGKLSDVDKKAALQSQADDATREILDMLRLPSIEAAESVLNNTDRTTLEAELTELKARFDDQDRRTRELFSMHGKAADQVEAVGGDAAVAKIEEQRRTILLEIEEGARRYLRLRLGIVAAEHALRSYRQHHRSSMMSHASAAFRTISRGAYTDLASQPNKEKEDLIAIGADGGSKIASALSKGTRFQLYLALRVAGYHEFARMRPPVPFIADDIMETFDDFRAEEAIRLLANMGEVGQVIYLTHHRHLCDIAQRVCPEVRVHELSSDPG